MNISEFKKNKIKIMDKMSKIRKNSERKKN